MAGINPLRHAAQPPPAAPEGLRSPTGPLDSCQPQKNTSSTEGPLNLARSAWKGEQIIPT